MYVFPIVTIYSLRKRFYFMGRFYMTWRNCMLMYDTLYETLKPLCLMGVLLYRNNLWKFIYLPIKPFFFLEHFLADISVSTISLCQKGPITVLWSLQVTFFLALLGFLLSLSGSSLGTHTWRPLAWQTASTSLFQL